MGKRKVEITLPKDVIYNKAAGFVSENRIEQEVVERLLMPLTHFQRFKFSVKKYEENGFYLACVTDSADRLEIDLLQNLLQKESFSKRDSNLPVFNSFSTEDPRAKELRKRGERVDCGRNMIHISKTKELELKKQSLSVGSMLQRLISKDLNLDSALKKCSSTRKKNQMVLTVLETVQSEETDAIPDQLLHSDVNPADSTLDAIDAFIGILATQIGMTELRVLPRSHSKKEANTYQLPEFIYRIQLPRYYYLVGHPFLIHGGCGSLNRNTRLHFYHGLSQDSQSQTFFVPWKVKDTTEKLIQMRANAVRVRKLKANNRKRLFKT